MNCYNMQCKYQENCDILRYAACLKRITKEQYEFKKSIDGSRVCEKCGSKFLLGKLSKTRKSVKICTCCKSIELMSMEELRKIIRSRVIAQVS